MLHYIPHSKIDPEKWDVLVQASENALVYSWSWYLNGLCKWDAIVLNNYEGAIALPRRRKYGFLQLYQPPFIQQCSWFGKAISDSERGELLTLLKKHFLLIRFNSNIKISEFVLKRRPNLILPLKGDKKKLFADFSKDLRKNLSKSTIQYLVTDYNSDNYNQAITLYRQVYGARNKHISDTDYENLKMVIKKAKDIGKLIHLRVLLKTENAEDECVAILVLLKSHRRIHYILGAPTVSGRKYNALSFALWDIIGNYAGSDYILDFEGSSIPSVARFYRSFGSKEEYFSELHHVPPVLRFLMRLFGKKTR